MLTVQGHGIPVQSGGGRIRCSRRIDENGGNGAPHKPAFIYADQKPYGRQGIQNKGKGNGNGHGHHGSDAGYSPYQLADQNSEPDKQQIIQGQCIGKACQNNMNINHDI